MHWVVLSGPFLVSGEAMWPCPRSFAGCWAMCRHKGAGALVGPASQLGRRAAETSGLVHRCSV